MVTKQYFAKSFEEDFVLKTVKWRRKKAFQSIDNVLKTKIIKLNTRSFGRDKRLACSFLHKNYLKTYRTQGLIFKTSQRPDYIFPFDLALLTNAKKIVVHCYRITKNLHIYYNHDLIPGFERFVFKDIKSLLKDLPTLGKVWTQLNKFRVAHGHKAVLKQQHKLIEYNEVVYHKPVQIVPVAIFGYRQIAKDTAKKYSLPHFETAKKFYESLNN